MFNIMNHIIAVFLLSLVGCSVPEQTKDSVQLTLFYESYCPYSISFIVDQLVPTWKELGQHIHLDLVPFGNAKQSYDQGHFNFTCQHGPKECFGNKLHACAVHEACHDRGSLECPTEQLANALYYINCVVHQRNQERASDECANANGLHPATIKDCAGGPLGEWLKSGYGNQTRAFQQPTITHVPFIVINDIYSEDVEDQATEDLKTVLCSYIPDKC